MCQFDFERCICTSSDASGTKRGHVYTVLLKGKNRNPNGDSPMLQQRLAAQTLVVQQRYGEAAQARTMLRTIGNREPQNLQELRNLIWLAIRGEEYLEMNLDIKGSIDLAEPVLDLANQCD